MNLNFFSNVNMKKLLFIIVLFFSLNVLADEYMIIKSYHDHNIIHMKFDLKDELGWVKEFKTLEICNQYLIKNYKKKQFGKDKNKSFQSIGYEIKNIDDQAIIIKYLLDRSIEGQYSCLKVN